MTATPALYRTASPAQRNDNADNTDKPVGKTHNEQRAETARLLCRSSPRRNGERRPRARPRAF